jgi:hypothetical protein
MKVLQQNHQMRMAEIAAFREGKLAYKFWRILKVEVLMYRNPQEQMKRP